MFSSSEIEKKWQAEWDKAQCFKAENNSARPKFYSLDMFPYPSGTGLHIGHLASYTPGEVLSRMKRAQGFNVLHPMGFDAFGLPAEQYAIQTGVHPAKTTEAAIANFKRQLKSFGYSFDWNREVSTCDPKYYKWTQFIFTKLFEKGLAYQKEVPVNWCPALKTVLANEEVVDGKSERGGHPVIRQPMKQWMLKITDYADRLLQDLDLLDWPERTKEGQRNWIGKSVGANVDFMLENLKDKITVFTTRPDTLFGASFVVLAPEHPLVSNLTIPEQKTIVENYQKTSASKLEVDRKAATTKSGVFTGGFVLHPLNNKKIPVWIADCVLMDYGTGAIMAVPGHDERDFEFAEKFQLPIVRVVSGEGALPWSGEGNIINSEFLNGLIVEKAKERVIAELEKKKLGTKQIVFKLRDWLFSRQRYWGEPFPVVHFEKSGTKMLPLAELPVVLPEVVSYEPSEKGEAPLARNQDWVRYASAASAEKAWRETDTMPGSAGSSWYFLRYCDPNNDQEFCSMEQQKYWMPVDLYVGGPEHTVGHLLYARFWHKFLFDLGLVTTPEPFQKLAHQGMILGADGEKMSKSRGNVVNLDDIHTEYGADALRTFICFLGPMDKDKPWSANGIEGIKRFFERIWRLTCDEEDKAHWNTDALNEKVDRVLNQTILKVTADIESLSHNTAISQLMILVNELTRENCRSKLALVPLAQMLMPFAPHLAEELWKKLNETGFISLATWPKADASKAVTDQVTLGVQVNGKLRGEISVSLTETEVNAVGLAMKISAVNQALGGKPAIKIIYKAGKILNMISAKNL